MKKTQKSNPPNHPGLITQCLQQMIKVTGTLPPMSNKIKSNTSLDYTTIEKPREKVPTPFENPDLSRKSHLNRIEKNEMDLKKKEREPPKINQKKSMKTKKNENLKENNNNNENLNEIVMKIKSIREEEQKIKLKDPKNLEYSLILEDLKFRLIQKSFLFFLHNRVMNKTQKQKEIFEFKKNNQLKKLSIIIEKWRGFTEEKEEKRKFKRELIERWKQKVMGGIFNKMKGWYIKKMEIKQNKEIIMRNSMRCSLRGALLKMKENGRFLRNLSEFKHLREKRIKFLCFLALKQIKITLESIRNRMRNRDDNNVFESKSLVRAALRRKIKGDVKGFKTNEFKIINGLQYINKKMIANNGKFNLQEISKLLTDRNSKFLMKKAFSSLKLALITKRKSYLALSYYEKRLKSQLLWILKRNLKNSKEIYSNAYLFSALKLKQTFMNYLKMKMTRKNKRNQIFYLAKSFNLLKKYSQYKRNKKSCLISISQAYHKRFRIKILHSWFRVAQNSKPVSDLYKHSLKKRMFRKITEIFKKRELLRKYLVLLSVENTEKPEKSAFVQLKEIMKAWRQQVLDSENSKPQKIRNFMALNHRQTTLKFRVFSYWTSLLKRKSAVISIFSHFTRIFNVSVFQKWRKTAIFEKMREISLEKQLLKFKLNLTFQKLKSFYLQRKIIRVFRLRQFLSKWKQGFQFRRVYWPKKLFEMNRKKQIFDTLRKNVEINNKKIEIAKFLQEFKRKRIVRAFFKQLVINVNHSKKIDFARLCREYKLKKIVWKGLLMKVYMKKLREKQNRIADRFRQEKYGKSVGFDKTMVREHVLFKVFSVLKTHFLRKKAEESIVQRFKIFRRRKILRNHLEKWFNKLEGLKKVKTKKTASIYAIDLKSYQTPKFDNFGKSAARLKESKAEENDRENNSSYANWLKEYEENEKYMNFLLEEKKI